MSLMDDGGYSGEPFEAGNIDQGDHNAGAPVSNAAQGAGAVRLAIIMLFLALIALWFMGGLVFRTARR